MAKAENTIILFQFPFGCIICMCNVPVSSRKFGYTAHAAHAKEQNLMQMSGLHGAPPMVCIFCFGQ